MERFIGIAMIVTFFVGLFGWFAIDLGIKLALIIYIVTAILVGYMLIALWLIYKE